MKKKVLLDKVFNNDTCFHFTRSVNLYNIEMNGLTSVPEKRENMTKTDEGHDTIYFSKGIIGLLRTADVWIRWEYDNIVKKLRENPQYKNLPTGDITFYDEIMELVYKKFYNDEKNRCLLILDLIDGEDYQNSDYNSKDFDFKKIIAKNKGYLNSSNMKWEFGKYSDLESLRMENWNMYTHLGKKVINPDKIKMVMDNDGNTDMLSIILSISSLIDLKSEGLDNLDGFVNYFQNNLDLENGKIHK